MTVINGARQGELSAYSGSCVGRMAGQVQTAFRRLVSHLQPSRQNEMWFLDLAAWAELDGRPGSEEAADRIWAAIEGRAKELDLSGLNLVSLPHAFGLMLPALERLNLSDNQLVVLPDSMAQMKNLVALDLRGNCLS